MLAQLEAIETAEAEGELLGSAASITLAGRTAVGGGSAALAPPTVALPEAGARSSGSLSDRGTSEDDLWAVLEAWRPSEVRRDAWEGMFEYVAWKLTLLIGQHHVLAFARDLCRK